MGLLDHMVTLFLVSEGTSIWVLLAAAIYIPNKNMGELPFFKSKDITLPTKVCLVKAMVFPVVMYGCENWTVKKAEC